MIEKSLKLFLSALVSSTLLATGVSAQATNPTQDQTPPQQNYSQPVTGGQNVATPAPPPVVEQTPEQLDSLVAPIALYPDALVAQVLAAAVYPEQVAFADDWLTQNQNLSGDALTQAVDQQSWDPSVKALTQFPSVLHDLAKNLSWTSNLGQAFTTQQADVMAAVQTMRARAQAAGTLQSSSQIQVVQQSPSTIVIQPANPQVVYVPQYNPAIVYGAPVAVPLYVPPPMPVAVTGLYFGSGITIGAAFGGGWGGGGFGWGWHAWNVNWVGGGGGAVVYNNRTVINRTVINRTVINRPGYHPGVDTHYGPNGAYHPNGYYGPNGGWHRDGPVNHAGGATGTENRGSYSANGTYHPDPGYHPGTDTHYGPNGAYHPNGYFGPHGGFHPDAPGTNPNRQPNGGDNGNHGLIGGNGGVQHGAADYGNQRLQARNNGDRAGRLGGAQMDGRRDGGDRNFGARNRGRGGSRRAPKQSHPHRSNGGGRHRR
ncbi:MAG TPA: DUF3300 domain-containing protein [Acidobacteriaceae bacterium]|nr:DUF3300 domain-containing protein [Acidobacteriaceae bacterium]